MMTIHLKQIQLKCFIRLPNNSFTLVNDKENKIYLVKLVSIKKILLVKQMKII